MASVTSCNLVARTFKKVNKSFYEQYEQNIILEVCRSHRR